MIIIWMVLLVAAVAFYYMLDRERRIKEKRWMDEIQQRIDERAG